VLLISDEIAIGFESEADKSIDAEASSLTASLIHMELVELWAWQGIE
jgi:hypothetical protein